MKLSGGLISFFSLNTFKIEVDGWSGWLVKFKIEVNKKMSDMQDSCLLFLFTAFNLEGVVGWSAIS